MQKLSRRGFVGAAAGALGGIAGSSIVGTSAAKSWATALSADADARKWVRLDPTAFARLDGTLTATSAYSAIHAHLLVEGFHSADARADRSDEGRTSRRSTMLARSYVDASDPKRTATMLATWKGRQLQDVRAITRGQEPSALPQFGMVWEEDNQVQSKAFATSVGESGFVYVEFTEETEHCMGAWIYWCERICDHGSIDPECLGWCMSICYKIPNPVARALCLATCEPGCKYPPYCCDYGGQQIRVCT